MRTVLILLAGCAAFAMGVAMWLALQPEIATERFPGRDIMSNGNQ